MKQILANFVLFALFLGCFAQQMPLDNYGLSSSFDGNSGCRWLNSFNNGVVSGLIDPRITANSNLIRNFTYMCNGTHVVNYQTYNYFTGTYFPNSMNETADNAQLSAYGPDGCKVVSLWCGYSDAYRTVLVNQRTLFPVFSVSKTIYMVLLGIAQMDDYFDWDDNFASLMPGFQITTATVSDIFGDYAPGTQEFSGFYDINDITLGSYNHTKMRNFVNTMSLVAPVETLNGYNTVNHGVIADEFLIQLTGMNTTQYTDLHINNVIGTEFYFGLRPDQTSQLARLAYLSQGSVPVLGNPVYAGFVCQAVNCTLLAEGEYVFRTDTIQGRSISPIVGVNNFISNYIQDIFIPSAGAFGSADDFGLLFNFICQGGKIGNTRFLSKRAINEFSQTIYNGTDFIYFYTNTSVTANGLFKNSGSKYYFSSDPNAISHSGASGAFVGCSPTSTSRGGVYAAAYTTSVLKSGSDTNNQPPSVVNLLQAIEDTMSNLKSHNSCP